MPGRVVVVGLGPAGADHVLPVARRALERTSVRFARTARHPAVAELAAAGVAFESFDAVYDVAPDLEHAYGDIARGLVAAADEHGEVVYAVPGSPVVAERSVALLREADVERRAGAGRVVRRSRVGDASASTRWKVTRASSTAAPSSSPSSPDPSSSRSATVPSCCPT